jgi:hypothetical protein
MDMHPLYFYDQSRAVANAAPRCRRYCSAIGGGLYIIVCAG